MKTRPLMTAIKMYDGTVIYSRDIEISEDGIWMIKEMRSPQLPMCIEEFELHEDSIEVWFDIYEGGKNGLSESTDGAPTSTQ